MAYILASDQASFIKSAGEPVFNEEVSRCSTTANVMVHVGCHSERSEESARA